MIRVLAIGDRLRAAVWALRRDWGAVGAAALVALGLAAIAGAGLALRDAPSAPPVAAVPPEPVPVPVPVPTARSAPVDDPERALLARLPLASAHPADLEALLEVAARSGVKLEQGRLRVAGEADDPLQRIEIELRVVERWSALRGLLASAMNRMPHLALSSLKVSRETADAERVDAQLVMTWIYRRAAPAEAAR